MYIIKKMPYYKVNNLDFKLRLNGYCLLLHKKEIE